VPACDLEVVAFDLDNTLYDETQYFDAAFAVVAPYVASLTEKCAAEIEARLVAIVQAKGRHYHRLFTDVLEEYRLPVERHLPEVLARFRGIRPRLALFAGARALLDDLRARYRLGLITSGMQAVQENKVALLGIGDCFDRVVYSSTLPENKPSALPFRHCLESFGVVPGRAAYVGDNPLHDFHGPNQLGMLTIRVRNREFDGIPVASGWDARHRVECVADVRRLLL